MQYASDRERLVTEGTVVQRTDQQLRMLNSSYHSHTLLDRAQVVYCVTAASH
jgi:hypothetical protein